MLFRSSLKDVPSQLGENLIIACVPKREAINDVLITMDGYDIDSIPSNSVIGSSSLRRAVQIIRKRPDLSVKPIRGKKVRIVEKPKKSKSNLAITGLYLFDKNVSDYSKKIKLSKRKETEIVDLINIYNRKNKLKITDLGRGSTWLDTGTIESLLAASTYVQVVEERQKYKIACLEEIALSKKWINKKNIINRIKFYGNCSYSMYLKRLLN